VIRRNFLAALLAAALRRIFHMTDEKDELPANAQTDRSPHSCQPGVAEAADAGETEPPPPTDPGNLPEPPKGPQN
jgi:hypothetical protein